MTETYNALPAERADDLLGIDADRLAVWAEVLTETLTAARGGEAGPDTKADAENQTVQEWWGRRAVLLHRDLLPRVEALRDYAVARHEAAGASYGDLAVLLGYARDDRSEAQRLRRRAADESRPHHWWPSDPAREADADSH